MSETPHTEQEAADRVGTIRPRSFGERVRWIALAAGLGCAAAALAPPLDELGTDGLLTAHVAQHVVLADLAAPLVLLGLPRGARRRLRALVVGLRRRSTPAGRLASWVLAPVGAAVVWAVISYVWYVPAVHRAAAPDGVVHVADHASFLFAGFLVWLGAFDPRRPRRWSRALWRGGLPWWARHVYAMATRVAMLPPALAVWLADGAPYHPDPDSIPFDLTAAGDQERAASVLIGFEMLLFSLAVVLAFIFASVYMGRQRESHPGYV